MAHSLCSHVCRTFKTLPLSLFFPKFGTESQALFQRSLAVISFAPHNDVFTIIIYEEATALNRERWNREAQKLLKSHYF